MRLFFTAGTLEYFNIYSKKMETTNNKIPFIVNQEGKLEDDINTFLLFKTESDWNPNSNTPRNNAQQLLNFLEYSQSKNIVWKEISHIQIRKWVSDLTNDGLASGTIIQKISVINALFDWLYKHNYLKNNPFLSFGIKEVKRTINVFSNKQQHITKKIGLFKNSILQEAEKEDIPTKEEVKEFYNFLPKEDQLMALIIIETGIRKEELLQLNIEMIKQMKESQSGKSYTLLLDASKIRIKNNKSRNVIVSSELRQKIIKHYTTADYLNKQSLYIYKNEMHEKSKTPIFISNRGNLFSHDKLNKSFKEACIKSGYFEKNGFSITPHNLRHFFASHFIANKDKSGELNEDVFMYLSERLGHSDPETTKKYYIKITNRLKQREDMEKYSELFISEFLG